MLTPSPLPPRGVFVPTCMLFHTELPSAVLITWIQLRALAWKGWSTPPMSLAEFASILGIHPSRLEKHLHLLQAASTLSQHPYGSAKLVLSFPELPPSRPDNQPASFSESDTLEHASYFPHQVLGYITYDEGLSKTAESAQPEPVHPEPEKTMVGISRLHSLCTQEAV